MKLFPFTAIIFLFTSHVASGQSDLKYPKSTYSLSYSGNNLWNPGVNAALDYPLLEWASSEAPADHNKIVLLRGKLGFFLDPGSHAALYSNYGFSYKHVKRQSRFISLSLQPLGIYRSMFAESYAYEEDAVRRIPFPGNFYYAPEAGIGFGKQLDPFMGNELFVNLNVMTLIPYNTYFMPLLMVDLGYRFGRKGGAQ